MTINYIFATKVTPSEQIREFILRYVLLLLDMS